MTASRFDAMPPKLPADTRRADPFAVGMASLVGLVVIGFVAIGLGYHSVSQTVIEAGELPGLLSGSIAGICLVAVGCVLAIVYAGRRHEAALRVETAKVTKAAAGVLRALEAGK